MSNFNLIMKLLHDFATPVTALLNTIDCWELDLNESNNQIISMVKSNTDKMRSIIELWRKLVTNVDDQFGLIDCEIYCAELNNFFTKEKKISIKLVDKDNISIQKADFIFKFLFILIDIIKYDAEIQISLHNDESHFRFIKRGDFTVEFLKGNEFFDELIGIEKFENQCKTEMQSDENFYYLKLKNK